ncbi:porin [Pseudaquabacterium rugosum]|uniref:Porin n=1 Tax=Pseudaquabacterium rugosum TaxID=2984194 RepID=A0ABU9BDE8_9BURK
MKHPLLLAAALCAGTWSPQVQAQAQTAPQTPPPAPSPSTSTMQLQVYGQVDIGLRHTPNLSTGAGGTHAVDDASRSRIGVRGKGDLGGGAQAFFRLEHSLRLDTGTQRDTRFWDDKAWVGVEHAERGSLLAGRLRAPLDEMTSGARFEAFEGLSLGAASGRAGRADDAWDNAVYATSRAWQGWKLGLGARAGERTAGSAQGLHLERTQGAWDLGLAVQRDGESTTSTKRSWGGGLAWRGDRLRLMATHVATRDIGATDAGRARTSTLGLRWPAGPGEVRAALRRVVNHEINGAGNRAGDVDTTHLALGYQLPLARWASLNGSLVHQRRTTHEAGGATATRRSGPGVELALRLSF